MKVIIKKGSTDQTVYLFIQDSSSSVGAGLTSLAFNSASLVCYYVRPLGSATALTLATQTVTGSHSDGGFVEVSSANMPGVYRLDLSDAIIASGVNSVVVMLKGAANMVPVALEIQLVDFDPADATRLGLSALPNAAAAANGGLPTVDASNAVLIRSSQIAVKKNTALSAFMFLMLDSSDHVTPKTGLTITAERSIDGGAFASCANSAAEVSAGWYKIDLAAGDLNGNVIALKFTGSGADARNITLVTQA